MRARLASTNIENIGNKTILLFHPPGTALYVLLKEGESIKNGT